MAPIPAAGSNAVRIEGLTEFRAALRRAQGAYPRKLTVALKKAGVPIIARARSTMPRVSGLLSGSLKTSVRGSVANVVSSAPYAGGAEWGQRGKWRGWVDKHGAAPRFVWPAMEALQDETADLILAELKDVVQIYGWAHG